MSQEGSITENVGNLIKKAAEVNQKLFSEAFKAMQGMNAARTGTEKSASNPQDRLGKALEQLLKLNLEYASNMVELGLSVAKDLTQPAANAAEPAAAPAQNDPVATKPAFILQLGGQPGELAVAHFMLDSDKDVPIQCAFQQSGFVREGDPGTLHTFETSFNPQNHELAPRASVKVEVQVQIPGFAQAGRYGAHVVVEGFEHAHFAMLLTVSSPETP